MIQNLLIDLGGVIMDIRRTDCVKAFKELGFDSVDRYLNDFSQTGPFELLEEGRISPDEFRRSLRSLMPEEVTDAQIDEAFEKFLVGIPVGRLHELRQLRSMGLGLYLLSNTNPIMWNGKIKSEFAKEGRRCEDYFDGILTSFEAGVQKPEPAIFKMARDRFNLDPATTLFIDDSQANLDAAEALGFRTLLAVPGKEFGKLVEKKLQ
ncbi:MAG: HAD family phosphatase [Bacteroides sp.]|nr:HAD family phosphatase [Bacteroides sp.]